MSEPRPLQAVEPPKPDPEVVAILEEIIDRAKKGEVQGIGFQVVVTGGECSIGYRGVRRPYLLVGMLEELKAQVLREGCEYDGSEIQFTNG